MEEKIRGSVYYQSAELCRTIFKEGAKKIDRINSSHKDFQKISSYQTMTAYRAVWENLFNYLKEHWKIKDCEKIEYYHIQAYIDYKIEYYPSKQYLQKIVSAIGKLEVALNMYSFMNRRESRTYDFSIRTFLLQEANDLNLVYNNYHNRAYKNPLVIINALKNQKHQLAAMIELEGGARVEACSLIKKEQLIGLSHDKITDTPKAIIYTSEKGGKEGPCYIDYQTYRMLERYIKINKVFKINRQEYFKDIRNACDSLNIACEGTHGFRWNFAQNRMFEYAQANYTYEQSLLLVSSEMKHNRASITEHYL